MTEQPRTKTGRYSSSAETALRRTEIERMREQGWTIPQIATSLGVTTRTVDRLMPDRFKTRTRAPSLTEEELAIAKALLEDGAGYDEAARTIGRASPNLARRFPGYALTRSESLERAHMAKKANSVLR